MSIISKIPDHQKEEITSNYFNVIFLKLLKEIGRWILNDSGYKSNLHEKIVLKFPLSRNKDYSVGSKTDCLPICKFSYGNGLLGDWKKSIVQEEQSGSVKAEYGIGLLKELSTQLTADFGKGLSEANLKYFRQFYLTFHPIRMVTH